MSTATSKAARLLADLQAVNDAVKAAQAAEAARDKERAKERRAIVSALVRADSGPATRRQLAEAAGLSPSAFYDNYGADLDKARDKRRARNGAGS